MQLWSVPLYFLKLLLSFCSNCHWLVADEMFSRWNKWTKGFCSCLNWESLTWEVTHVSFHPFHPFSLLLFSFKIVEGCCLTHAKRRVGVVGRITLVLKSQALVFLQYICWAGLRKNCYLCSRIKKLNMSKGYRALSSCQNEF